MFVTWNMSWMDAQFKRRVQSITKIISRKNIIAWLKCGCLHRMVTSKYTCNFYLLSDTSECLNIEMHLYELWNDSQAAFWFHADMYYENTLLVFEYRNYKWWLLASDKLNIYIRWLSDKHIHWRKYKHATIYIEQFIRMPQLLFSISSGVKIWPRFVLMNSRGGDFDGQINLNYYKQFWKMHLYILHLSFSLFRCWCKVYSKHWMRMQIVYFVNHTQNVIVVYI